MKLSNRPAAASQPALGDTDESLPQPDLRPGPHDQALQDAQEAVIRAEAVLDKARDHRARVMITALQDGYSVYLPVLTYRLLPFGNPPGVCGPTTLLSQLFVLLQYR